MTIDDILRLGAALLAVPLLAYQCRVLGRLARRGVRRAVLRRQARIARH